MELAKAVKKAKRVYLCGNGGSAANAIHIANDLVACGIKAQALTADVATLTAIANDDGYEHIFSWQLYVFGEPGDLLIVLSGSGRSPNIIAVLNMAEKMGIESWAIFGKYNKPLPINVASFILMGDDMQEAEEAQLVIGHDVMRWLKNGLH